jgi:hypothetical protein
MGNLIAGGVIAGSVLVGAAAGVGAAYATKDELEAKAGDLVVTDAGIERRKPQLFGMTFGVLGVGVPMLAAAGGAYAGFAGHAKTAIAGTAVAAASLAALFAIGATENAIRPDAELVKRWPS